MVSTKTLQGVPRAAQTRTVTSTGGQNMRLKTLVAALLLVLTFAARSEALIQTNAIIARHITAGVIDASKITAHTLTAAQILGGSITATELNVATLSAITANLGTVTAGTISLGGGITMTSAGILSTGVTSGYAFSSGAQLADSGVVTFLNDPSRAVRITGGATGSFVQVYLGHLTIDSLSGNGGGYACLDNGGTLYWKASCP
jgi:hypothetical protein